MLIDSNIAVHMSGYNFVLNSQLHFTTRISKLLIFNKANFHECSNIDF